MVSWGLSISPNSRFIYVSSRGFLYQFDLLSTNIATDYDTVAIYDGYYSLQYPFQSTFGISKLAPDGKIYISSLSSVHHIHVINYPDSLGVSCDVQQHSILLPAYNRTIPSNPNYLVGPLSGSVCDSLISLISWDSNNKSKIFNVFYNSANSTLSVNLSIDFFQPFILEVSDILGRIIYYSGCVNNTNLNNYKYVTIPIPNQGIYCATIQTLNAKYSSKFIKSTD